MEAMESLGYTPDHSPRSGHQHGHRSPLRSAGHAVLAANALRHLREQEA